MAKKAKDRSDSILAAWNMPGVDGFKNWLKDVNPHILKANSRHEPAELEPWQWDILNGLLAVDDKGTMINSMALFITPRRHSKTTLMAFVVLWLFTSRQNITIQVLGTTEDQSERVQMKVLKRIINHTPALSRLITKADIQGKAISFPAMGNSIQTVAGTMGNAFGDKLNVLWCGDFHANSDGDAFEAMQASLLDSDGTFCLIDANPDSDGGHVHALEKESITDPRMFCHRIEYADFEEYCAKAPGWIDRQKAKRLQRTLLPHAFDRDILGKRSSAKNALFPTEIIDRCRGTFLHPVMPEDLPMITEGRKYVVGGGLDRSKKLFGGDNTVWTVTMKVAGDTGEPEYYILNQKAIVPNHAREIKKTIQQDHDRYKLDNVTLENYEVGDLKPWLDDQGIPCELIPAHDKNQNLSFVETHRIAKEGRLHFSDTMETLISEMGTFVYEERDRSGGVYSFGHSSKKFHDDHVYSLNWSIFATRANVLTMYALPKLVCNNRSTKRCFCFLMGGEMELFCSQNCEAYHVVREMYQGFKRLRTEDEIMLPGFFTSYVKLKGPMVYQQV